MKKRAADEFRGYLQLRWGGFAGIDPRSMPGYLAYAERVLQAPPVAMAAARERIRLDTYKA